ncbi:uncharacterized protein LOC126377465 [Pectinophora gossypiella]|uniref:uncharacterized protein LOC126377465 n=1 Tax=Pectinophora gossypiella TaxID=13191 RepID=UPI00214F1C6B|nr:uncharacterized protein LOC126377465 [Pectinophora gossypiella]
MVAIKKSEKNKQKPEPESEDQIGLGWQTEELVIQIEDEPGDAKGKNNDEKEKKENPTCDAELSDKLRREHIINMLTEKQPEAVIGGEKRYIVAYFEKAPPTGEQFHYENGNRNDFVRLVFLIVFCMLVVTAAFTFATYNLKAVQKAFRTLPFLIAFIVCCVMTIVLEYIFCLSSCSRSVPCNYILLVIARWQP